MGRGFPLGRGKGKDGEPKPDLQKLGMKFGGQRLVSHDHHDNRQNDNQRHLHIRSASNDDDPHHTNNH